MTFRDFQARVATVRISRMRAAHGGPAIYERETGSVDAAAWVTDHAQALERDLHEAGSVLLRGFGVHTPQALDRCLRALYGAPMSYQENTSVRTTLLDGVRTSTDHPADQWIEQHCEQSYSRMTPTRLLMACAQAAHTGGHTPLCDTRRVLTRLPRPLLERLDCDGYLYRARFRRGIRPGWQETYLIDDRDELQRYLDRAGIAWCWTADDELVTEIRRPAVIAHPRTGELVWFNHILFWHHSSLERWLAQELVRQFGGDGLPHAVFHGDGTPFADEDIEAIRQAHRAHMWMTSWYPGDLLLLDNLLSTHGRAPYSGPRRVMFAMACPFDNSVNWATRHRTPSPD
jgi:alpha-ketoglutarate-dependent taurine dioxygenase